MDTTARSRLAVLSRQLEAASVSERPQLASSSTAAASGSSSSSSYASATGQPSSYARVHGQVSRAPAQWRRIATVAKEELVDVKYEKAEGEGIAKVRPSGATSGGQSYIDGRGLTRPPRGPRRSRSTGQRSGMPSGPRQVRASRWQCEGRQQRERAHC